MVPNGLRSQLSAAQGQDTPTMRPSRAPQGCWFAQAGSLHPQVRRRRNTLVRLAKPSRATKPGREASTVQEHCPSSTAFKWVRDTRISKQCSYVNPASLCKCMDACLRLRDPLGHSRRGGQRLLARLRLANYGPRVTTETLATMLMNHLVYDVGDLQINL